MDVSLQKSPDSGQVPAAIKSLFLLSGNGVFASCVSKAADRVHPFVQQIFRATHSKFQDVCISKPILGRRADGFAQHFAAMLVRQPYPSGEIGRGRQGKQFSCAKHQI